MSKLSEMMDNTEKDINEKSKHFEQQVDHLLNQQLRSIESILEKNLSTTKSAILDHTKLTWKLLLKSWIVMIFSIVIGLSLVAGLSWYKGREIADQNREIVELKNRILELEAGNPVWGIWLHQGEKGKYIVFQKGMWFDTEKVWTIGENPALKLIETGE